MSLYLTAYATTRGLLEVAQAERSEHAGKVYIRPTGFTEHYVLGDDIWEDKDLARADAKRRIYRAMRPHEKALNAFRERLLKLGPSKSTNPPDLMGSTK